MTKKVIPIYQYEFQYRYFRYIGIPNIPNVSHCGIAELMHILDNVYMVLEEFGTGNHTEIFMMIIMFTIYIVQIKLYNINNLCYFISS